MRAAFDQALAALTAGRPRNVLVLRLGFVSAAAVLSWYAMCAFLLLEPAR